MEIKTDFPLGALNTFGVNVDGKYFTEVASVNDIREATDFSRKRSLPVLVLGGGSNILFRRPFPGLVMRMAIVGREVQEDAAGGILVKAGAGEVWDDLVAFCVENGYCGLENLSLIPGSVGASPIQNIGAYGVEMKDRFESLEFYDPAADRIVRYGRKECRFGYRNSIFKEGLKGKGIILTVTFRLSREPAFNTAYGSIREELERMGVSRLSTAAVRDAVIRIRNSKLPDPRQVGNAGSFFKNPTVSAARMEMLMRDFPALVFYPQARNTYKLAAGWLIEQCGWKGYRKGDAGVHDRQALVLVNYGNATGDEVYALSEEILDSVYKKFGVRLEREVNVP